MNTTTLQEPQIKPQNPVVTVGQWFKSLAYRNQAAEWSLYFMITSGLLLWEPLGLPWAITSLMLAVHLISSLILFPLLVLPFWLSHRALLKNSKKKMLVATGQLLDLILYASLMSGIFLFWVGNRGDQIGWWAYIIHLITALLLAPLLMKHAAKWSVLAPLWSLLAKLKP